MIIEDINDVRLADYALSESKITSFFVENQFPAIYREEGRDLIELVKSYYEFLETQTNQSSYNIRRIYDYRNIDTTLDRMLIFFKNKYMNGLFLEEDTRFLVKNILDLYRRKGSKEGIELFFKLFFDTEVEIYYPSEDIFKPSSSQWNVGTFIQLYAVDNKAVFKDIANKKIFGDKSQAEAFVDNVYFIKINKSTIPILFISDVRGRFSGFDIIYSRDPDVTYGRVYGSLRSVDIDNTALVSGSNRIGDIVDISSPTGYGAKGRVSKISQELSGEIDFQIVSGGYGYTLANTVIELSNQTLFFADPETAAANTDVVFIVGETVQQTNSQGTLVTGSVIGLNSTSVGLKLDLSTPEAANSTNTYFFEGGIEIATIDRLDNISVEPVFITEANDTAAADIGTIRDTEDISIIVDRIGNYLDVTLDSLNYSTVPPALLEMSGTRVNSVIPSLTTALNEAFVPEDFTLGVISSLSNINPGIDYFSDTFVSARENIISRFNLRDQIIRIIPVAGIILFEGDEIRQFKTIETFVGGTVNTEVKGRVVKIEGSNLYVTQLTFESFILSEPIFKLGNANPITVLTISKDTESLPIGLNAKINGTVETITGKIEEIDIIDSGFGYADESTVEIYNLTKAVRDNINPVVPIPQSDGGTFTEEVLKVITDDPSKSEELDLFLKSISLDGYSYGDIDQTGKFTSADAAIFEQIAAGTAPVRFISRWNDVIVPPLINTEWFKENTDLFIIDEGRVDSVGFARSRDQGLTEGKWVSFISNINGNKVIQDSLFYQDYSYEINTDVSPEVYEKEYRELLHPSGMKLFTKFTKTDIIDVTVTTPQGRITEVDLIIGDDYITDDAIYVANTSFQYLTT